MSGIDRLQGNLLCRDARLEFGCQQIQSAQLAVQKEGSGRRCVPKVAIPTEQHAGIANAGGEIGVAKIIGTGMTKGFAGQGKNIQHLLALMRPLMFA